ncbi:MAG: hypothetical protein IIY88_05640 [Eubacterium sp.]|nr:hypothetical protein [Eubacterium sp.]
MKKKFIASAAAALCMILVLAGCSKEPESVMHTETTDTNTVVVTAENAAPDTSQLSGTISAEEGDLIRIESALDSGEIDIIIIPATALGENASVEELTNFVDSDNAILEGIAEKDSIIEGTVPAGEYYVGAVVTEKATGTVTVTSSSSGMNMPNPWTDVNSTDEAAEGAGLDMFRVPEEATISLGDLIPTAYRYMDGLAEVQIAFPAVDMTIRKGKEELGDDVSGDFNEYKYEWTQNIKGLEVTCFGNREGDATKTIYHMNGYSYSITAYGRGGDDDYGISPDDINSIVNGMQ